MLRFSSCALFLTCYCFQDARVDQHAENKENCTLPWGQKKKKLPVIAFQEFLQKLRPGRAYSTSGIVACEAESMATTSTLLTCRQQKWNWVKLLPVCQLQAVFTACCPTHELQYTPCRIVALHSKLYIMFLSAQITNAVWVF